jgi:hypothetical protein
VIELPEAQPKAVSRAAATVRSREADLASARATVVEAAKRIDAAIADDRQAYADALDRGEADPGRQAEGAARAQLEECQRRVAAEEVRLQRAEVALREAIVASAETWRSQLDAEAERGRGQARRAVGELRAALALIGDALSTRHWLDAGKSGDFRHRPVGVTTGSFAPSSRRRTANSEPLTADEIFAYVDELVDPPAPKPMLLGAQPVESKSDAA